MSATDSENTQNSGRIPVGISGRVPSEWVADLRRNQWPGWVGIRTAKVKADIAVNYNNGNTTLSNFSVGQELGIGDLMFDVGGFYTYGVVLNGHTGTDARLNDGLAVGFYALTGGSNGANTQDSTYYLTPTSIGNYRENNPVRVNSANATLLGAATVTTTLIANAEVNIHVEFVPTLTFLTAFNTSGLSVHFAAATCANDVIDGNIKGTVPEPASLLMLGTGLVGLAAYRRRQTA